MPAFLLILFLSSYFRDALFHRTHSARVPGIGAELKKLEGPEAEREEAESGEKNGEEVIVLKKGQKGRRRQI